MRTFGKTVVVHARSGEIQGLAELVEQFIHDGVKLVAIVGVDCARVRMRSTI